MKLIFIFLVVILLSVLIKNWFISHKKYRIWEYKHFLKLLRDCKKEKNSFDEKLRELCYLEPNLCNLFSKYYNREKVRQSRRSSKEMIKILKQIREKL